MASESTREKLLGLIHDIEIAANELLDHTMSQKGQKLSPTELVQLSELLVLKDSEIKKNLKVAEEQVKIHARMQVLQVEVDRLDQEIYKLQKQLKDCEQILLTAIYQGKQKLNSIAKANRRPIQSEELIKYAHRISSTNAVVAPLNWQQGDPRRPYPTDIEMRMGVLGRLNELPPGTSILPQQPSMSEGIQRSTSHHEPSVSTGGLPWHSSDIHVTVSSHNASQQVKNENEDVEVMSTDSSSSSSSDSQ